MCSGKTGKDLIIGTVQRGWLRPQGRRRLMNHGMLI